MTRASLSFYISLLLAASPALATAAKGKAPPTPAAPTPVSVPAKLSPLARWALAQNAGHPAGSPAAAAPRKPVDTTPARGVQLQHALETHTRDAERLTSERARHSTEVETAQRTARLAAERLDSEDRRLELHRRALGAETELGKKLAASKTELEKTELAVPKSARVEQERDEVVGNSARGSAKDKHEHPAVAAWRKAKVALSQLSRELDAIRRQLQDTLAAPNAPTREELAARKSRADDSLEAARTQLQTVEADLGRAVGNRDRVDAEIEEYKREVRYEQAKHVYTTLDALKQAPPQVGAKWNASFFTVQKRSAAKAADNRDVISVSESQDGVVRLAVADGSSDGDFAGQWAQLVAHRFTGKLTAQDPKMPSVGALPAVGDRDSLKAWLTPLHDVWYRLVLSAGPMARLSVKKTGGMSTLIGVELRQESGHYTYRAEGAGDTTLFVLRKSKVDSWPMKSAADFNSNPAALSFLLDTNPAHAWKQTEGKLEAGDQIIVATDALAKWILLGGAKANERLGRLAALKSDAEYAELVKEIRTVVVDDDSSFARLVVPAVGATPAKVTRSKVKTSAKEKE